MSYIYLLDLIMTLFQWFILSKTWAKERRFALVGNKQ